MRIRPWWLIGGVAALVGCRHAPPPTEDSGRSSFAFVAAPVAPPPEPTGELVQLSDRNQWYEANLMEPHAMPVYPARALQAKAGRNLVGVHIIVDVTGHVREIRMSMLVFSTPGPFAGDFRDAVELAVRQWRFTPARAVYYEIVHDGEATYNRTTRTENVETEFDLAFTFQPDGSVRPGSPEN